MKTKTTFISRDPFARFDTVRRRLPQNSECAWCGQTARFEYGSETDSGKQHMDGHYFCSIGCRKDYYQL